MEESKFHKSKLEKLEQKLYSVDGISPKERPNLTEKNYDIENSWQKPAEEEPVNFDYKPKRRIGVFTIILILAFLFFTSAFIYAGYIFLGNNNSVSASEVDLKVIGPVSVGGGEVLSVDVLITNNNSVPLELVDLFADYPDGSKNPENLGEELKRSTLDLGSIGPGSVKRETLKVALFGESGSNKAINFTLQYRIPGSNAIFEKKKEFDIALNATPIRLAVSGLEEISAGQPIELTLKFNSNSTQTLKNVLIVAEYPFGFRFDKSDIKPTYGNNVWQFDEIKPNEEKTFVIDGFIEGQNQEDRIFRFNAGLVKDNSPQEIGVLFTTVSHATQIAKSFIGLSLNINDNPATIVAVNSGESNKGEIIVTNNTNDAITNLELKLTLAGTVLSKNSVNATQGFYQSIDNTIAWNKDTDSDFTNIAPRSSANLTFNFKTLALAGGKTNINNPQIDISAKITGIRIATDNTEEKLTSDAFKSIKVNSDTPAFAHTYFDKGPITNTGPVPPKVDTPTTYTVEWDVSNNSNDLTGGQVIGTLPPNVSWKNVFSPSTENLTYDPVARNIIWNLGDIAAGTGYSKTVRQIYFQVELLPSISQVGQLPSLVNNIIFTARDTFTGKDLSQQIISPSTQIEGYSLADRHGNVVE